MSNNNEFYEFDIQVKDLFINVVGYPAEKIYSYLKENNGFVPYENDAVQLPRDLNQRVDVLNILTTYLNIYIQEAIIDSEYQQDYNERIAPKINSIDSLINLYKKNGHLEKASNTLEDLTYDLSEFREYIFSDNKQK